MKTLNRISSIVVMITMVIGMFSSPAFSTSAVVNAQDVEPTPVVEPVVPPTEEPVIEPTEEPVVPIEIPTDLPTEVPSEEPTAVPSDIPTEIPTEVPTDLPTEEPTAIPTDLPTEIPTLDPTLMVTVTPTVTPTEIPTESLSPTAVEEKFFKWKLETNLDTGDPQVVENENIIAPDPSTKGMDATILEEMLANSTRDGMDKVREAVFMGENQHAQDTLLSGPSEILIYVPAEDNQEVDLALEAQISTGFAWNPVPADGVSFAKASENKFEAHSEGKGVTEVQSFKVKSSGTGEGAIRLEYKRPFEDGALKTRLSIWMPAALSSIDLTDPNPALIAPAEDNRGTADADAFFEESALRGVPVSWDWRTQGIVPAVRNQLSCGSCWAFGTVGIMESAISKATGSSPDDLSEQFLVSCNNNGWSCSGGFSAHFYHQYSIGKSQSAPGAVLETAKPYTQSNGSCTVSYAHPYALSDWRIISTSESTMPTVDQIKKAIYTYGPVTAGICAGANFQGYSGGVMTKGDTCTYGTNHQIILVGWNDADGAWILRNSWGTTWGEAGYMRIKYNLSRVGEGTSWAEYGNSTIPVPTVPTMVAPKANAVLDNALPELSWIGVPNATSYTFEINGSPIFPDDPIEAYDFGGTLAPEVSAFPSSPLPDGVYYWRVQAVDANGKGGDWSKPQKFTISHPLPAAPKQLTPAANFISNSPTPTFTWGSVFGGVTYQIQVHNTSTFVEPIFYTSTETAELNLVSGTSIPDGIWYWRVRANNAYGGQGKWSAGRKIIVDTTAPVPPTPIFPSDGASLPSIPTFKWSIASTEGAKGYIIECDDESSFTPPLVFTSPDGSIPKQKVLTSTSYKPTYMSDSTTLYWRVKAVDAAGNWGDWSTLQTVVIGAVVPKAPTQMVPVANAILPTAEILLSWTPVYGGNAYVVQIDDSASFPAGSILFESTPQADTFMTTAPLMEGTYYWRVKALNSLKGDGKYSSVRKFTIDRTAPAAPTNLAPLSGVTLPMGIPTFKWSSVPGAKGYQLEYDDNSDFSSPVFTSPDGSDPTKKVITSTSYKPASMTAAITYYWHVRAKDAAGNWGEFSTGTSVVVQAPKPATPVALSPVKGAVVTDHAPLLTWKAATNAVTYQIQISKESKFTSLVDEFTTVVPDATSGAGSSLNGGILYWRIRGINANGIYGSWSAANTFTINDFNSDFNDTEGWAFNPGASWSTSGGILSNPGLTSDLTSSAHFDANFKEYTYEVRMKKDFDSSVGTNRLDGTHGIVVNANPSSFNSYNNFISGFYFEIGQVYFSSGVYRGCYSVWKISNGYFKNLTGGSYWCTGTINFNDYNVLKAVAGKSTIEFYVNNSKLATVSNSGATSGVVGVESAGWSGVAKKTYVDWAKVYPTNFLAGAMDAEIPTDLTRLPDDIEVPIR